MLKYFKWSFITTIVGLICAYLWGEHVLIGNGFKTLYVALFLSILEITLSFDNAIINAVRLQKMSKIWQKIFLTLGIIIAVFGVRLVLPIFIVTIFSRHSMLNVLDMALHNIKEYTNYLQVAHTPLVVFGGIFLLLIFFEYFLNPTKEGFWIKWIEEKLSKLGKIRNISIILSVFILMVIISFIPKEAQNITLVSGFSAIILHVLINGVCDFLEKVQEKASPLKTTFQVGLFNFIYLELIDASFSFDGLLGAFAISKDIFVIMIGLGIGAMFVRSLTVLMVNHKTLDKYLFLEHGAHWAIGFLALIMFISIKTEVPEYITGTVSLFIIVSSLISSIRYKNHS